MIVRCAAPILLLALGAGSVLGDSLPGRVSPPCDSPQHRQFDFWVGSWEVRTPNGDLAGTNRIEKVLDGCVLEENWSGARGMRGKSFNLYSAADRKWHQTWVDTNGWLLRLSGGIRDGKMVLEGEERRGDKRVLHRITWESLPDQRVRQHWENSENDGRNWSDVFVGFYARTRSDGPAK